MEGGREGGSEGKDSDIVGFHQGERKEGREERKRWSCVGRRKEEENEETKGRNCVVWTWRR
jgi:hypothetical protein